MKNLFLLLFPLLLFSQSIPPIALWEQIYDFENTSSSREMFFSIYSANNNEFLLATNTSNNNIIKINTEGNILWEQGLINYYSSNQTITKGQDNSYYMLATNCQNNQQNSIQQFDEDGTILENWCLPENFFFYYTSIISTNDGGLLISSQHILTKFNAQKEIQWTVSVHPDNVFNNLLETSDGHFLAVGGGYVNHDEPEENQIAHCYFVKLDTNGNIVWEKDFGAPNATLEGINTVTELPNGNYLLNCYTDGEVENGNISNCLNPWMVTTDPAGNIVNNLTLTPNGTLGSMSLSKIILEQDGGYVVGAWISSCSIPSGLPVYAFRLIKANSNNTIAWDVSFTDGIIYDIERTAEGDYIAVGTDYNPSVFGSGRLKAMKIGWEPLSTPSFENSVSIYPNPAQDYIMVKNNFSENQTVVIYNVAGQTIMKQEINQNENRLHISQLANGIYFVHLPESNTTLKWIKE